MPLVILLILFLLSFSGTGFIRHYALTNNVLDIPNHRSSHVAPTPRGGGLAFVIFFLVYLTYLGFIDAISGWTQLGLTFAGCGAACLGFMDDHIPIAAKYRLLGHFLISGFALYCLGGMSSITVFGWTFQEGTLLVNGFALLYLVWFLNLYNFMDGIDGLAAIEAIFICLSGAIIQGMGAESVIYSLPTILATVVGSFLCWNFPRARVFMGDVGSCFLGLMIGLFSIQAASINPALFWTWIILGGIFIVDATLTLLFRAFEGQKLYEAHRSHAYQLATDHFNSHLRVTLGILCINLLWLFPIALTVALRHLNGLLGVCIAYFPLILLVLYFRFKKA